MGKVIVVVILLIVFGSTVFVAGTGEVLFGSVIQHMLNTAYTDN